MSSLRRTLLVTLLGAIVLISALNAVSTYLLARAEIDGLMDYQLRQLALSLRNQHLTRGFADPLVAPDEALDVVIQIWDVRGVRLYLSHPHTSLPSLVRLGFSTAASKEGSWRVYAIPMPDHVIQVAQRLSVRTRLAARAALQTLLPTLATIPVLGVLIWLLVSRGLRPLQILTREVHHRRPDALAPIDARAAPEEVGPLVDALNQLLARLARALDAQREFIADAAHELRTPLAALQIQLQLAESAADAGQRQNAHETLRGGLARSIHLVNQLLTLARLEPGADEGKAADTRVALDAPLRSVLVEHAPLAAAKDINLGATRIDGTAVVRGAEQDLRTLLANLVSNAVKYTPPGGQVDVALEASDQRHGYACLRIDDSGPGIPEAERERVFDRFYRRGTQGSPGTGLGLAIVQRIANRHHAEVVLGKSPLGGLRVELWMPLDTDPADSPAPPP